MDKIDMPTWMSRRLPGAGVLFVAFALQASLCAQNFERIAPKTPQPWVAQAAPPALSFDREEDNIREGDNKIMLQELTGVVFLGSTEQVLREPMSRVRTTGRRYFFQPPAGMKSMWYYSSEPLKVINPAGAEVRVKDLKNGSYRFDVVEKPGLWSLESERDHFFYIGAHGVELAALQDSGFVDRLKGYLGNALDTQTLRRLKRDIVQYYRRHGYPVAKVIVPDQDIANGILQLVVLEGQKEDRKNLVAASSDQEDADTGEGGNKIVLQELTSAIFLSGMDQVLQEPMSRVRMLGRRYFFQPPAGMKSMWYWSSESLRVVDPAGQPVRVKNLPDRQHRFEISAKPGLWSLESESEQFFYVGVHGDELTTLQSPEFVEKMKGYLGKPLSLNDLNQMTRDIIQYYRRHGRPVVDVIVPEQDITPGVVQFVILEGRLGQMAAAGNRWFSSKQLLSQISTKPGEVALAKKLTEDVNWLNSNPFRQVNVIFSPGKKRGETDLTLKTQDRLPLRAYGGYEDSGTDLTGDERWLLGLNWGNAFWLDHQLNYQFTGSSDFRKFAAHSGSHVIPLPWRHRLTFFGSYVNTVADIANPLFSLGGRSWQAGSRYIFPLPDLETLKQLAQEIYPASPFEFIPLPSAFSHSVAAGFDFKQSNNNLEFGGAQVFNTTTDVAQWSLDYNAALKDAWGGATFTLTGVFSPGRWTARNHDPNFTESRASAKAEYGYGRASLERTTRLPWDFSWVVRGSGQWAEANLLGSEQFGLGGYNTVRGYEEHEANGDVGYLISTEIRTPPLGIGSALRMKKAADQLQIFGFFDYGGTQNHSLLPGEDPHRQLAGAGPGMRYTISPSLTLRFDYGWQLYDTGLSARFNSRGHLGFVLAY